MEQLETTSEPWKLINETRIAEVPYLWHFQLQRLRRLGRNGMANWAGVYCSSKQRMSVLERLPCSWSVCSTRQNEHSERIFWVGQKKYPLALRLCWKPETMTNSDVSDGCNTPRTWLRHSKVFFLGSFLSRVRRYSIENSLIILTPENRTCDMCAQRLPNTGWCHVVSTLRRFVLALFPIGWISPWLIIKSSCFGTIETTHSLT